MNRSDFQRLATVRLEEAKTLLEQGKYAGCYYLSGYAIKCALKACIARMTKRYDFPDKQQVQSAYTHDLSHLVRIAGLELAREERAAADPIFKKCWYAVKQWNEQSRYSLATKEDAERLLEAIADRRHGVLRWIQYW